MLNAQVFNQLRKRVTFIEAGAQYECPFQVELSFYGHDNVFLHTPVLFSYIHRYSLSKYLFPLRDLGDQSVDILTTKNH